MFHESLKRFVSRAVRGIARCGDDAVRDRRNVDTVLEAHLRGSDILLKLNDPVRYVDFLRSCLEHIRFDIRVVKSSTSTSNAAEKRFETLLALLQDEVPPVDFNDAQEIGLLADRHAGLRRPLVLERWAGDMGLNFSISSSFGRKGRLLSTIIRFMRSRRCLELGTAYGMSASFILTALMRNGDGGRLTTIEGSEDLFALASPILRNRYGEMVSSWCGLTQDCLSDIVTRMESVDFIFHDAAHSREDYVRDFNVVSSELAPGAIVLFDDIRWEDQRLSHGPWHTYEGWLEVVAHPSVAQAVEVDYGRMGLVRIR
jgi:predicted O-methyltransferase YrrM